MILNHSKVIDYLTNWISSYLESNNKKTVVFELDQEPCSILNALILKKANIIHQPILFYSDNDFETFLLEREITYTVDPIPELDDFDYNSLLIREPHLKYSMLLSQANLLNGIVLDNNCLSSASIFRTFSKSTLGDIGPLHDLHRSEVLELIKFLDKKIDFRFLNTKKCEFTDFELEWAFGENTKYSIIEGNTDPVKHHIFMSYTARQQTVISKLYQREKLTRHKMVNIPIAQVRKLTNLVT